MAESLLTPRDASKLLGVPEGTLAQWRSQKRGSSFIKLEVRLVRYRRTDLDAYLSERLVRLTNATSVRRQKAGNVRS